MFQCSDSFQEVMCLFFLLLVCAQRSVTVASRADDVYYRHKVEEREMPKSEIKRCVQKVSVLCKRDFGIHEGEPQFYMSELI